MSLSGIKPKKGFGLMVVLIMLGVVSMIASSVALRTQRSLQSSQGQTRRMAAEDAAYSGLQVGLAQIETNGDSWPGLASVTALPQVSELGYRVFVNSNFTNTSPINDADGTEIPPRAVYLKSVGYFEGVASAGVTAVVAQEQGTTFNYPAFATDSLSFQNSTVSAVDSAGNLSPGSAPIRTNGDAAGVIDLASSFVDGDVTVGPTADPAVALTTDASSGFSGTAGVAGTDLPLPSVVASYDDTAPTNTGVGLSIPLPPPFNTIIGAILGSLIPVRYSTPAPGTYSSINVDNATLGTSLLGSILPQTNILVLSDGDYYVSDFSTSDGAAIIVASANTRLHVRDTVNFNALNTNVSASGFGLQLYQTSPSGSINLQHTIGTAILSSQGTISLDTSVLTGAAYGTNVSLHNTQLLYPEALDGTALAANVAGGWRLFGQRRMKPSEVATY